MAFYDVDGQKVHVVEEGLLNRQVALLIHGWSSSWFAMSPLMGPLSQRFRCMAVDLPGYGRSPPLPERATITAYADLLAELICEVSDGPVVLVGHSMGGMTAVTLARRHPVLVERMVLIAPTITGRLSALINFGISPVTMLERFGLGRLIVASVERTFVGLTDRLMRPASFAERSGITREDYERLRADARRPGQGRVRAECFFAMRENDLSGQLGQIQSPALVLWGAEDNTVPLRDAGVVDHEWPAADLRILPNAGHWPHFEAAETTRRIVAAYLGLPLYSDQIRPVGDETFLRIQAIAQFLAHSDLGSDLSLAHRTRLAAQCEPRHYAPGERIAREDETGNELYLIHTGIVEVWNDPDGRVGEAAKKEKAAELKPGQITGELAMLDRGKRSADLIAGPEGTTVLALERTRLLALCEDDAVLGTHLLWNMATAVAQRTRFILWQLDRATLRAAGE